MPITLEGIQMEDNYEDDFLTRRALVYTLNFTCKTYLFSPINNSSEGLSKKLQTDYYTDTDNLKLHQDNKDTPQPQLQSKITIKMILQKQNENI